MTTPAQPRKAEHTPLNAFRAWFRTLAEFVQLKRGLGEALQSPVVQEEVTSAYAPVVSAVGELITSCAADGSMREGLDPEDVLVLMRFMTRARAHSRRRRTSQPRDGTGHQRAAPDLRTQRRRPCPGPGAPGHGCTESKCL